MKPTDFHLFGPPHIAILLALCLIAFTLIRLRLPRTAQALALFLTLNEIIWYTYRYSTEGWRFPEGLPLQLCDAMVWLTIAALLTPIQWIFEAAFLIGIAGAGMALITPDLWAPLLSYPSIYFFLVHGAIVISLVYLRQTGTRQLNPGCVKRAFFFANGFGAVIGAFNAIFHTNYMYLCRKPLGASPLDWFGPWPVYLIAGEAFALLLFFTLARVFKKR